MELKRTMRAAVYAKEGRRTVVKVVELPRPEPGPGEFLVRVRAASVTRGDVMLRLIPKPVLAVAGLLFGFKPKSGAGVEFAGEVAAVGPGLEAPALGERIFGTTTGLVQGANAEYLLLPARWKGGVWAPIPKGLSFEEAAVLPVGAMTAMQILERAGELSGKRLLVYGASGSVGSFAVQFGALAGARVTAVASGANEDFVRALGPDEFLDYGKDRLDGEAPRWDACFDAVGKLSRKRLGAALPKGAPFVSVRAPTTETRGRLERAAALAAQGKLKAALGGSYPLERVMEAHEIVESGRKRGNYLVRTEG